MTFVLLVLVKVAVAAMVFSIGLHSTFSDLTYLWERPGLLLRCPASNSMSRRITSL